MVGPIPKALRFIAEVNYITWGKCFGGYVLPIHTDKPWDNLQGNMVGSFLAILNTHYYILKSKPLTLAHAN